MPDMDPITLAQLQLAVEHWLQEKEVENVEVTLDGELIWFASKFWWVGWEKFVKGYGRNHMPTPSIWQFEVTDGVVAVCDSMGEDGMSDAGVILLGS